MKQLLFVLSLMLGGLFFASNELYAGEIFMEIVKEGGAGSSPTKTPDSPLLIIQNENVLTLPAMSEDLILQLRDEDGYVVYSSFVPAGTTQIVLPSTLTGTFELRLVGPTYYYVGSITL